VAIRRPLLPKGSNNETATHASCLLRFWDDLGLEIYMQSNPYLSFIQMLFGYCMLTTPI